MMGNYYEMEQMIKQRQRDVLAEAKATRRAAAVRRASRRPGTERDDSPGGPVLSAAIVTGLAAGLGRTLVALGRRLQGLPAS